MAELIASGTTQADSADFVLADASATLYLKNATGSSVAPLCWASVQVKSGSQYFNIGHITGTEPLKVLTANGTFRVRKHASADSFGVDRD